MKKYRVVNEERWETFKGVIRIIVVLVALAVAEHFLGPFYR